MHFTSTLLLLPILALAAPLSLEFSARQQIIPTLPPLGIPEIRTQIHTRINQAFGISGPRGAFLGDYPNTLLPIADTLAGLVGRPQLTAIDVLADRLCIAGAAQGSLCNLLFIYAHTWYVAQQNGWTYQFVAQSLGPNNMEQIDQAVRTLCIQPADDGIAQNEGLCQRVSYVIDQTANALIGENTEAEDIGNSNSLEYFGIQGLLPKPAFLGI